MKSDNLMVSIIDNDLNVCDALRCLFESVDFYVETYNSAHIFLDNLNYKNKGCLIIDVRMPIMDGLELLEQLNVRKNRLPVIMITGFGDMPMAIKAMKLGAIDFVLKPINPQYLLDVVQKCFEQTGISNSTDNVNQRMNSLSERERQVIDLILEGRLNKQISYDLSISISTVEAHRANIMRKMKAKNLAQLIKMCLQYQLQCELP